MRDIAPTLAGIVGIRVRDVLVRETPSGAAR